MHSTKKSEKSKDRQKKRKDKERVDGRNEGTVPSRDYAPPPGVALPDAEAVDFGEFDYDALKGDEDAELWLIRVPNTIKPKHLKDIRISAPSSSRTGKLGSLQRKNDTYDIWTLNEDDNVEGGEANVGGEELRALSALLPRAKKGGKLYLAPKPITRHLVFTAPPAVPSTLDADADVVSASPQSYKNPPRPAYSEDVLTHRFLPYGARTVQAGEKAPTDGDVEMIATDAEVSEKPKTKPKGDGKKSGEKEKDKTKAKKRKVEVESPKRAKKAKTNG